jgi:hypothetical protein
MNLMRRLKNPKNYLEGQKMLMGFKKPKKLKKKLLTQLK